MRRVLWLPGSRPRSVERRDASKARRGGYAEPRGRRPEFRKAELAEIVPEGEARKEAAPAAAQARLELIAAS